MSNAYIEEVRELHPAAYKSWTEEEESELVDLVREGKTADEIAVQLGRQPGGIRSRIRRLEEEGRLSTSEDPEYELVLRAGSLEELIAKTRAEIPRMEKKAQTNQLEERRHAELYADAQEVV